MSLKKVNRWRERGSIEKGRKERKGEGENVPFLLPPTDTDSVTIETFSSLNLISLATQSFSSLSLPFNHLQVPLPTVDCNCQKREKEKKTGRRGDKKRCNGMDAGNERLRERGKKER